MANTQRPLSPHMQVYRPQLTSVLSITHRATGIALSVGLVVLVWWLSSAAAGAQAYDRTADLLGSVIGRVMLFGFTFSFFYHLCNGIRHLMWDIGKGFEIAQIYASGWAVVIAATALTVLTWAVALLQIGGGA